LIPVLVYAPRHIAPRRVDRLMSQVDIAPTLLGLLDFRYYTKFLGRDVLQASPETDRAFVGNFQTLGYLKGDRMVVLHPRRKVEWLRHDGARYVADSREDPALAREAIAFYQVASRAFRSGWYGDEEQLPPDQRPAKAQVAGVRNF
jgi:arylsulfatase A-like enzyme